MGLAPAGSEAAPLKQRRGWLIGFGIVEILIGCFSLLASAGMLLFSPPINRSAPAAQGPIPPTVITALIVTFYAAAGALFLLVGIGSLLCKNWARITMLIVSGIWLGIGLLSAMLMALLLPAIEKQAEAPQVGFHTVFLVLIGVWGFFMILMPAVFLVFYSRKSVKATCLARAGAEPRTTGSGVPVPVVILAIWQGLGALSVFFILFLRPPTAVLFDVVLHGAAAYLFFLVYSVLCGVAAWLIYRRNFTGWAMALLIDLFFMASTVAMLAGHALPRLYAEVAGTEQGLRFYKQFPEMMHVVFGFSLVFMGALLAFIWYTKKFFIPVRTASPASGPT